MLTDEQLAEMRARCEGATGAEKLVRTSLADAQERLRLTRAMGKPLHEVLTVEDQIKQCQHALADSHSRTDLPACLDEIDRLRAEVARLSSPDRSAPSSP